MIGLAALHSGLKAFAWRLKWFDHDSRPLKSGAPGELDIPGGIVLLDVGNSNVMVFGDQHQSCAHLECSQEGSGIVEQILHQGRGILVPLDMNPATVLGTGKWLGPIGTD
jgi:hypothetical protein